MSYFQYDRRRQILRRTAGKTQPHAPMGVHHVLELHGCPAVLLNDAALLSKIIGNAATLSNTKLLNTLVHPFPGHGVTALGLLAESHIAVHTWPEHGYAAIDLFACGENARPEAGCAYMIRALQARRHTLRTIWRGQAPDAVYLDGTVGKDAARDSRTIHEGAFGHDFANTGFQFMDK